VQQKNLVEFDQMLLERSTPGSPLFQNWFTFEEVGQLTSNPEGAKEVKDWLAANGIAASWESAHQDYIKASAPISKWEQLLDTKFYQWEDHSRGKDAKGVKRFMHRAEQYSLPEEVKPHLFAVFNTVQVPPVFKPKYQKLSGNAEPKFKTSFTVKPSKHGKNLRGKKSATDTNPSVTVQFLNEYYNITSNEGDATMSQSVFETAEESFSPTDLTLFQQTYGLPVQACEAPYGYSTNDCVTNDCSEGNLDVQYIMGIAQLTTTIYWYVTEDQATDPFVAWVADIANTSNPPLVNSMSWGSVEQAQGVDVLTAFNTEAMKLTSMGVTVTVSSGDNGAASDGDYCNYDSSSATYNTGWTVCLNCTCVLSVAEFSWANLSLPSFRQLSVPTGHSMDRRGLFSLFPRHLPVRYRRGRHHGSRGGRPGDRLPVPAGRRDHFRRRLLHVQTHAELAEGSREVLLPDPPLSRVPH
jgi:subtilase family serine protease